MTRQGIRLTIGCFAALFFLHALVLADADAQAPGRRAHKVAEDNQTPYVAALLMEPGTGQIFFEQDIHKPWPPASLTKMMLMLIVMERLPLVA